ncbi:Na+/H+ antiporter subunit E [Cesiribacter andamanensis]|uniref:Multiple resistance and pH homeostasis protein E n=1 Tax=Cesiribacter andamanensis AMV16 TaxID=1279009 RepID=M7N3H8_9BACT|nr:Na+/H+ antiporter subunit E [Cesiribacter andamanensis]EMR01842.1 Multiple resistance and pH homeostasis protein E [Cesiribacter andamanensis AMV16]
MKTFGLHILLAIALAYLFFRYQALLPYTGPVALLVFALFFGLLWLSTAFYKRTYFRKLPGALALALYFIREVFVANMKIAYDIITPRLLVEPTVIAYPLTVTTDLQITLLACMFTLTPGSLSLDVSEDKRFLYVHILYLDSGGVDAYINKLKNGFEHRLLQLTA